MNDPAPTFARLAEEAGADPDLYATCLSETGAAKEEAVRFSVAEAGTFGFTGTPVSSSSTRPPPTPTRWSAPSRLTCLQATLPPCSRRSAG
ncbi:MAG: hypothetical protein R2856_36730 [Caldilineaceae bacterium]